MWTKIKQNKKLMKNDCNKWFLFQMNQRERKRENGKGNNHNRLANSLVILVLWPELKFCIDIWNFSMKVNDFLFLLLLAGKHYLFFFDMNKKNTLGGHISGHMNNNWWWWWWENEDTTTKESSFEFQFKETTRTLDIY